VGGRGPHGSDGHPRGGNGLEHGRPTTHGWVRPASRVSLSVCLYRPDPRRHLWASGLLFFGCAQSPVDGSARRATGGESPRPTPCSRRWSFQHSCIKGLRRSSLRGATFARSDFRQDPQPQHPEARVAGVADLVFGQGYSLAQASLDRVGQPGGWVGTDRSAKGTVKGVGGAIFSTGRAATNDEGENRFSKQNKPWWFPREIPRTKPGEIFNPPQPEEGHQAPLRHKALFGRCQGDSWRPVPADARRGGDCAGNGRASPTGSVSRGVLGAARGQARFRPTFKLQDTNAAPGHIVPGQLTPKGSSAAVADISFHRIPGSKATVPAQPFRARCVHLRAVRDVPQSDKAEDNGNINTASDFYEAREHERCLQHHSRATGQDRRFDSVNEAETNPQGTAG